MQENALIGRTIGRNYRIVRLIEQGGMGCIFEAENPRLKNVRSAVKVLMTSESADEDAFHRFQREAEILSELDHPNIVRIQDYDRTKEGLLYFAMELLVGEDLESRVKNSGRIPPGEFIPILRQIGQGLQHAHNKDIVHRDLKTKNIFLSQTIEFPLRVKLLDFGISRFQAREGRVTRRNVVIGTPAFMSPEQARGEVENIDSRSDIFSLASVVFYCLTGVLPFLGSSDLETVRLVYTSPPPGLREQVPDLHKDVERVLGQAFDKDRDRRYQRVDLFVRDLIRALSLTHPEPGSPTTEQQVTREIPAGELASLLIMSRTTGRPVQPIRPISPAESEPAWPEARPPRAPEPAEPPDPVIAAEPVLPRRKGPPPIPAEPDIHEDTGVVALEQLFEGDKQLDKNEDNINLNNNSSSNNKNRNINIISSLDNKENKINDWEASFEALWEGEPATTASPEPAPAIDERRAQAWLNQAAAVEPEIETTHVRARPRASDEAEETEAFDAMAAWVVPEHLAPGKRVAESPTPQPTAFAPEDLPTLWPWDQPLPRLRAVGGVPEGRWSLDSEPIVDLDDLLAHLLESGSNEGRVVQVSVPPLQDHWPSSAAGMAAGYHPLALDLTDSALLLGDLFQKLASREANQRQHLSALLLAGLFPRGERGWRLTVAPELELALRLPPLLGWVGRSALERALAALFGEGRTSITVDQDLSRSAVDLCAPILAEAPATDHKLHAFRPLIGHWFLGAPRITIDLPDDADQRARDLGFSTSASPSDAASGPRPAGEDLVRCLASEYLAPHVVLKID